MRSSKQRITAVVVSALTLGVTSPALPLQQAAPPPSAAPAAGTPAAAPASAAAPKESFTKDQLEQLVAPIALYPDNLLAQIFMASTYPLEVVEAERWITEQKTPLKDAALEAALKEQDWDASVKGLCTLPEVVKKMSQNLDWLQDLGDAFLGQKAELMDAVQRMRGKANESGNLKTTEQQVITVEKDNIIVIESKSPEVVYVPSYSPTVVYGAWAPPYYYYPPMYPYYPPGYGLVTFGVGMAVGAAIWGGANWGWGGGDVNINNNNFNNFNRNTNVSHHDRAGNKGSWNHDAGHRGGVNYQNSKVAGQYGAKSGTNRVSRDQARGQTGSGNRQARTPSQSGSRGTGQGAASQRSGAAQNRGTSGAGQSRGTVSEMGSRSGSSSSSGSRGSGAYSGASRPSTDRASSSRGSSSRGSTSYGGGGGRSSSYGGGGGSRGGGGGSRGVAVAGGVVVVVVDAGNRRSAMTQQQTNQRPARRATLAGLAIVTSLVVVLGGCARSQPGTYATPEEAVAALAAIVGTGDTARAEVIFGPGCMDLFKSGDDAQDAKASALVKQMIAAKVDFQELGPDTRVALFGDKAWPFPIPLVRKDQRWRFDTEAGRQELLNRRVGYNELATLHSLHEYVEAQREYAAVGRDGKPPAFAQRFRSTDGHQDGLFWPVAEGEAQSPFGELVAEAAFDAQRPEPSPFRGYNYRILTGEGKSANAAERSYLDGSGLMTGGFAAIAWPAKYGSSGVMTFLVNHRGIVYQKDLGQDTATIAGAIKVYEPDATWTPTGDTLAAVEGAEAELADADAAN